ALCAYPPDQVTLLLDGEATAAAIRRALADLAARCDGDATVTVYFSGHGGRAPAGQFAGEYILPVDAQVAGGDGAGLAASAISSGELTALLQAIPARKLLAILDCCHAGGAGFVKEAGAALPGVAGGLSHAGYEALATGRGRIVFAAARPEEQSYLLPGDRNSLFTKHLLAGL